MAPRWYPHRTVIKIAVAAFLLGAVCGEPLACCCYKLVVTNDPKCAIDPGCRVPAETADGGPR